MTLTAERRQIAFIISLKLEWQFSEYYEMAITDFIGEKCTDEMLFSILFEAVKNTLADFNGEIRTLNEIHEHIITNYI